MLNMCGILHVYYIFHTLSFLRSNMQDIIMKPLS